ncbi:MULTISPECIES: hypothetical protein [unclassified Limnohabitans]|jgi:hypothetical protein|uniref:hypothetical protein n=1 Tax=unclassified Limnohabitans TaxID=2626134 RepID=UPI000CF2189B|nr:MULTISPECIES: hypothetical protein [unclassified Limnohabitans]PQA79660.1 hypothetical protein C5F52_29075 [Limnohabitans sp. TS-CS-82]BDU56023.1 hypothetical protein LTEGF4_17040 [Limnohabitans sp. TEGF004]
MKFQKFAIVLSLLLSTAAFAAGEGHSHGNAQPMHGGVVTEVKDIEYEFVARADALQLYLRDHGKPVNITKASAKVTMLSGGEKQEVELKPTGDKLEAVGKFNTLVGTKIVVQVINTSKVATVRFTLK